MLLTAKKDQPVPVHVKKQKVEIGSFFKIKILISLIKLNNCLNYNLVATSLLQVVSRIHAAAQAVGTRGASLLLNFIDGCSPRLQTPHYHFEMLDEERVGV